jgi:hypothetical protein
MALLDLWTLMPKRFTSFALLAATGLGVVLTSLVVRVAVIVRVFLAVLLVKRMRVVLLELDDILLLAPWLITGFSPS